MAVNKPPPRSRPVEIVEVDGTRFGGHDVVDKGSITVSTALHGSKTTQVGASPPEVLARMLLRELVAEAWQVAPPVSKKK